MHTAGRESRLEVIQGHAFCQHMRSQRGPWDLGPKGSEKITTGLTV